MSSSECVICGSIADQVLVCGHEFCSDCVKKVSADGKPCPLCRAPLNECLTLKCDRCKEIKAVTICSICDVYLCSGCWDENHSFEPMSKHKKSIKSNKCLTSGHSELNLVCIDPACNVPNKLGCVICFHSGNHTGHKSILLSEMTNRKRTEFSGQMQKLRDKHSDLKNELVQSTLSLKKLETIVVKDDLELYEVLESSTPKQPSKKQPSDEAYLFVFLISFISSFIMNLFSLDFLLKMGLNKFLKAYPAVDLPLSILLIVIIPLGISYLLSVKYTKYLL